jgi:hypothetical protein
MILEASIFFWNHFMEAQNNFNQLLTELFTSVAMQVCIIDL